MALPSIAAAGAAPISAVGSLGYQAIKGVAGVVAARANPMSLLGGMPGVMGISALISETKSQYEKMRNQVSNDMEQSEETSKDIIINQDQSAELIAQEIKEFKIPVIDLLSDIRQFIMKVAEINEGMLTNAAKERLNKFRIAESQMEAAKAKAAEKSAARSRRMKSRKVNLREDDDGGVGAVDVAIGFTAASLLKSMGKGILALFTLSFWKTLFLGAPTAVARKGLFAAFTTGIGNFFKAFKNVIVAIFKNSFKFIGKALTKLVIIPGMIISGILGGITGAVEAWRDNEGKGLGMQILGALFGWFDGAFGQIIEFLTLGFITREGYTEFQKDLRGGIANILSTMWTGITDIFTTVTDWFKEINWTELASDALSGLSGLADDLLVNIGLDQDIKDIFQSVVDFFVELDIGGRIKSMIRSVLPDPNSVVGKGLYQLMPGVYEWAGAENTQSLDNRIEQQVQSIDKSKQRQEQATENLANLDTKILAAQTRHEEMRYQRLRPRYQKQVKQSSQTVEQLEAELQTLYSRQNKMIIEDPSSIVGRPRSQSGHIEEMATRVELKEKRAEQEGTKSIHGDTQIVNNASMNQTSITTHKNQGPESRGSLRNVMSPK